MSRGRAKPVNLDYIDHDVAYLLGMILAREEFLVEGDVRRLVIQFPDRSAALPGAAEGAPDRETAIRLGLDGIRARVEELLETNVAVDRGEHVVTLRAVFTRNTIGWRDLRYLTGQRNTYTEFEVPGFAFDLDRDILVELVRGFADVAADPSPADRDQNKRHRIVLQVQFGNWRLPIQLCRLLQTKLNVAVSHILWGHPNLRAPKAESSWAKETRIRINAEDFEPIGFYFKHKQDVFNELLRANRNTHGFSSQGRKCNPKAKKLRRSCQKPTHDDEGDPRLPPVIRACHFDAYFEICRKLGCRQGRKPPQMEIFEDESSD